jgi:hypothetical protein
MLSRGLAMCWLKPIGQLDCKRMSTLQVGPCQLQASQAQKPGLPRPAHYLYNALRTAHKAIATPPPPAPGSKHRGW